MNTVEAWNILGEDWSRVVAAVSSVPSIERASIVDKLSTRAHKLARILMAKYHPDINKDSEAVSKFHRVQEALKVVETETENFKAKLKMKHNELLMNPKQRIEF